MILYLLDTAPLGTYLAGRRDVVALLAPWIRAAEAATSVLCYAELMEHFRGKPEYEFRSAQLRKLLRSVELLDLAFPALDLYGGIRRHLRPPYGPGLIGDIDTLIAATAIAHRLTVITMDSDFQRVPGLKVQLLPRHAQ